MTRRVHLKLRHVDRRSANGEAVRAMIDVARTLALCRVAAVVGSRRCRMPGNLYEADRDRLAAIVAADIRKGWHCACHKHQKRDEQAQRLLAQRCRGGDHAARLPQLTWQDQRHRSTRSPEPPSRDRVISD